LYIGSSRTALRGVVVLSDDDANDDDIDADDPPLLATGRSVVIADGVEANGTAAIGLAKVIDVVVSFHFMHAHPWQRTTQICFLSY
jgi:hypothetical protein